MLTLLKFEASWCRPCQNMKPVLRKLDEDDDNLIVSEIDIDDNPEEARRYHIRSIPCLVLIKDQQEIARRTGQVSLSELEDWISEQGSLQSDVLPE